VVFEAVAVVAGAGHTQGNPTMHAVEIRPAKGTLVAVAPEAASLLASVLFGASKVTQEVDALFLEDPFCFGQRYGYFPSPTLGRHNVIL
jgi:hypothetical protein